MTDKNLTVQNEKPLSRESLQSRERFLTPAVDIFETDNGLTLVADLPGMTNDDLNIDIDQGVLTLHGVPGRQAKGDSLFGEFSMPGYYRQFRLAEQLDAGSAEAELKNGVLTLHLPKAEAAKPKRIEIKTVH
ncbi:MAG: molecular chaperone [Desulfuromonas sp.]|nr:MAG: molecular chaperone [Desulfuromonas sp.]